MSHKPKVTAIPIRHEAEGKPVPIVSDAAVATALWGEGRTIPLLILDTSSRPDVDALVQAHLELGIPGDARSDWSLGSRKRNPVPQLILRFTKPSECLLLIEFDMPKRGLFVDQVLWAQGLYLQPGRPGERLITTMDNPRILVEIPTNEVFQEVFRPIHEKAIHRMFRKEGMTRAAAKRSTRLYLKEWRNAFQRRISFRNASDQPTESATPIDASSDEQPEPPLKKACHHPNRPEGDAPPV